MEKRKSGSPLNYNGVTIKVEPTSEDEEAPDAPNSKNADEGGEAEGSTGSDKTWPSERNLKAKILVLEGENGLLQDRLKRLEHKFKELSEEHEKLQKQYEDMKHVNMFLQKALFKDVTVQVKDSKDQSSKNDKQHQQPEIKCVPLSIATKNSCLAQVAVLPTNCSSVLQKQQDGSVETTTIHLKSEKASHQQEKQQQAAAFSSSSALQPKSAHSASSNRQQLSSYSLVPMKQQNSSSSSSSASSLAHLQEISPRAVTDKSNNLQEAYNRSNAPQDLMDIGGGVFVPKAILNPMTLLNYKKLTRILLCTLFPRKDLAECSVTGRPSNAHRGRYPPKRALDPHKVSSITGYVKKLFPQIKASMIRQEMALKLKEIQRFTGQRTRLRNHSMFWSCPPVPIKKELPEPQTMVQEAEVDPQDMEVEHITVCPNIEPFLAGDQSDSWNEGSDS